MFLIHNLQLKIFLKCLSSSTRDHQLNSFGFSAAVKLKINFQKKNKRKKKEEKHNLKDRCWEEVLNKLENGLDCSWSGLFHIYSSLRGKSKVEILSKTQYLGRFQEDWMVWQEHLSLGEKITFIKTFLTLIPIYEFLFRMSCLIALKIEKDSKDHW